MPNLLPNTLDVNIVRMYKALFDQAPGYTLLTAYRQVGDVQAVSAQLNAQFASLTNSQWAGLIVQNLHLTGQAATVARDYLVIHQNLGTNAVAKRADMLAGILLGYTSLESDGLFGPGATYFNNSVLASYEYSINPANTTTDPLILALADEPNTPPTVVNDTAAATEGGAIIAGTVAANDSDAQGDVLTYSLAPTQAPVPGLTFNSNGGFLFDPSSSAYDSIRAGATQQVVVNYRVSDGGAAPVNGTLTITVTGANDAPVAQGATASGLEDAAVISVTPASTDVDSGDTATYTVATAPLNGTVVFNSGTGKFDYTPSANFNGTDSFSYRVTDGSGANSTAVATVFVAAVNDAPTANAATASGAEDTNIGGSVTGSDIEGTALSFAVASSPAHGSVVLNSNGSFVYTPNANFNGSDTFTFTSSDGLAVSAARTVTITVTPVNDAPVALNVSATGAEDSAGINVAPSASDVDTGDTATYAVNSQPANGTVSFNTGTGRFVYVPNANFNGTDAFTYRVTDGGGLSSVATATVTVTAVNDAPVANSLAVSGNENTAILGSVTATDIDGDSLTYTVATTPTNGTVSLNALTGEFTYTSTPGYVGADSFTYTANDGNGGTSTATVSITVNDVANILTTGVDNVALSGAGGQTVIGNHTTYNPADSVAGSAGVDTVELSLSPSAPIVLGSANVNGVEIFRVNSNPITPADSVTVLMSNVGSALTRIELERSTGHNTTLADVQNIPLLELDDLSGNVTINIDNQVVSGASDALNVDVKEFGTSSSSTWGRGNLIVDGGIEILNVTDRAGSVGFPTDINAINSSAALNAGSSSLRTVNITGGVAGVPLTLFSTGGADAAPLGAEDGGIITGVANTGVRINSTAFLGNLVADIDAARNGSAAGPEGNYGTYTGVGNDALTAHQDVAGMVDSGAGNDTVLLSTASLQGTIMAGAGTDTVTVQGHMNDAPSSSLIDGGADNDTITVTGNVDSAASILGQGGNDTITVGAGLAGIVRGGDGNDAVSIDGGITVSGLVEGGEGNDALTSVSTLGEQMVGTMRGEGGDDSIVNNGPLGNNTFLFNAGVLDGGTGNDTITTNAGMAEGSSVIGGDGNDLITVNGALIERDNDGTGVGSFQDAAFISGGAGNDAINLNAVLDGDVDAGTENDTVTASADLREGTVQLGSGDDSLVLLDDADFLGDDGADSNDGAIDGGAGNDTMTLRSRLSAGTREMEVVSDGSPAVPAPPDGTDISSIETLNIESFDTNTTVAEQDHFFDVNLQAFDATLDTINVLERDDSSTVNLGGYDSEVINVDSDGDAGDDVTLNVSTGTYGVIDGLLTGAIHGLHSGNETLTVNLNGSSDFEVAINDAGGINVTNLSSNGGATARMATLDGADQDNNGGTAGEGNSLNITGTSTGRLTVGGIYQETVTATGYAGSVTLTIANDDTVGTDGDAANDNESLTINTGAGNDVVNMLADILDLGDGGVNMGAGTDRLIINESTRMLSLVDEDQVFQRVSGVEELELRGADATNGATPLQISLEDDLADAGVRKVIVTNDGATRGMTDIDVDADILDSNPGRFTFEIASGDADIDDGANIDKTVMLWANRSADGAAATGSSVNFTQTGSSIVDVEVFISSTAGATTTISDTSLAGPRTADPTVVNNVRIDVVSGGIDSLTLRDSSAVDNGTVQLTYNDSWSTGGSLTVDGSGILDNDSSVTPFVDGTGTGGLWFSGVQEDDTRLTVRGTQNDDTIWGSQLADVIDGNAGDDAIWGDPALGSVIAPGTQMVKTLTFAADDVEAGDTYTVTVGGRTYSWTAGEDDDTVGDAMANLAAQINASQTGPDTDTDGAGPDTDTDDVDGDTDTDVAVTVSGLTMTITGVDVDSTFGYALGENITVSGTATDRPTAIVTVAAETYDVGDVVRITVDAVNYDHTVVLGGTSASAVATALAALVNASVPMDAVASSNQVILRGATPQTSYTLAAVVVDVVPTAYNVAVTYGDLEVGETISVTFAGGITIAAPDVASLAAAINANGTVSAQWTAVATSASVLTLNADTAGSAFTPAPAFSNASFSGGDGGTATWVTTLGTGPNPVADNTDPTIAARQADFTFADGAYDAGDVINVTVNGATTPVTLGNGGTDTTNDVNLTGAQVAAQVSAAISFVGVTDSVVGVGLNTVRILADEGTVATFSVTLADITQTGPVGATAGDVAEFVTIDYSGVLVGATGFSATINGTTVTGATLAALTAAINANGTISSATGFDAVLNGSVIELTGPANGTEPYGIAEPTDPVVSGAATSDGGAVTVATVAAVAAVRRVETIDFSGVAIGDGAEFTIGATTYVGAPSGSVAATLGALATAINGGQASWTATVVGTDLVLTGPVNGSDPANLGGGSVRDPAATITIGAATAADDTNGETYTATLSLTAGVPTSISVTFDTNDTNTVDVLDTTLTGTTTTTLAALINATFGIGGTAGNTATTDATYLNAAAVNATTLTITGMSLGTGSTNQPLLVTFAGATGTASVVQTAPGDATSNAFTQTFTLAALDNLDITLITFGDGTTATVTAGAVEATSLNDVGDAIEAKLFPSSVGVVTPNAGADTVTVDGPNATTNPATTVTSIFTYTLTAAAGVVTTAGSAAVPAEADIDLTQWDAANESVIVTFANGESFTVPWNAGGFAASMADLEAAIEADTTANGDVNGAASWQDVAVVGNVLNLTGPIDGVAPVIGFTSAVIVASNPATPAEVRESWDNADNANPTVTVVSGLANTAPVAGGTAGIAAATAGANGSDVINGGTGNDSLWGMGGNDTLNGGDGNDSLVGGDGADSILGGEGDDNLQGQAGADVLSGEGGNDVITGLDGDDVITGGGGADVLTGGAGADAIDGGDGNDVITGGTGRDVLTGGAGADRFVFVAGDSSGPVQTPLTLGQTADKVVGFSSAADDWIDLTGVAGFHFVGTVADSTNLIAALNAGGASIGRTVYDSTARLLYVDVNGDGVLTVGTDMMIEMDIVGANQMVAGDFTAPV